MYHPKIYRHVMAACGGSATAAECSTVNRVNVDNFDTFKLLLSWDDKHISF